MSPAHRYPLQPDVRQKRELWVTRTGGIRVDTGGLGGIPGSMGTRSYIVEAKTLHQVLKDRGT